MIYSSIPAKAITSLRGDKETVKVILSENVGSFFTSKCLAGICNFPVRGSCVELRKAITELIEEEGCPIVSCSDGFSWTDSRKELVIYAENLKVRKLGLERRIGAVLKIARGCC